MYKPTKEELSKWKKDPITMWIFEEVDLLMKDYKQALIQGATYNEKSVESTALKTAETIGFLNGVDVIKHIEIK